MRADELLVVFKSAQDVEPYANGKFTLAPRVLAKQIAGAFLRHAHEMKPVLLPSRRQLVTLNAKETAEIRTAVGHFKHPAARR